MGDSLAIGKTAARGDRFDADLFTKRNDRWLTPLPLVRALGTFDLDPCGAPGHRTATEIWTPEAVGDGLSIPWTGRVWLNPPYGRTMGDWMRALALHGQGTALIFARTETAVFHEWVWPYATAILFLRGRVTFLDPEGVPAPANSGAPSVLIAYGQNDARNLRVADLDGHLVWLKPGHGLCDTGTDSQPCRGCPDCKAGAAVDIGEDTMNHTDRSPE